MAVKKQSADPIVFVAPVEELETAMPVESGMPLRHSKAKLLVAGTEISNTGAVPFAGTVVELKIWMNCAGPEL